MRKIPWRREGQPTLVFLPEEFHGQRSLAGCSPWDRNESYTIEGLTLSLFSMASKVLHDLPHPRFWLISLVQFSRSVMSNSLRPHGLQHTRLPCPSSTPGSYSNSCPSRWWCHPTISSSVIPFSSCLQSFPASGSFSMSQFFASAGPSIGVLASASVLAHHPSSTSSLIPLVQGLSPQISTRRGVEMGVLVTSCGGNHSKIFFFKILWLKMTAAGLPWWHSGWDSMLPMQAAIPGEGTRSHMLQLRPSTAK